MKLDPPKNHFDSRVTVTTPMQAAGSYLLTSNLRRSIQLGGSQNEHFIEILADDVSVDLGGFQISCATILGGSCSGSGSGVSVTSSINGASVKNGSITGMGSFGVFLGNQSEVSGLRVRDNGADGIFTGDSSTVSGSIAYRNGGHGIHVSDGSTVQRNTVRDNELYGLRFFGSGGGYLENVITSNTMGTVLGGVNAGGNVCNFSLTCP